jgi:nucleoside-diphosphate-sugar epimerase
MILLSGASGFLGEKILNSLELSNLSVITVGRSHRNSVICDLSIDVPILLNYKFDCVIHAAGLAHVVPFSKDSNQSFFSINVTGANNLLIALEALDYLPKHFVFISSVSVYGMDFGLNINESEKLKAKDPYGLSKIKAEKIIQEWCTKNRITCTILRLPLVVGPNPPGNLGSMIKGIKKGFYFNISGGKAKKSMVLAEDVAKHILKSAEIGGIYNLTDGYHPSFLELSSCISLQLVKKQPLSLPYWFAFLIAKFGDVFGNKIPLNSKKLKKVTSDLTFDDAKARRAFGWNPTAVLDGFDNL